MTQIRFDTDGKYDHLEAEYNFDTRGMAEKWLKDNWQLFPFLIIEEKTFSYMAMKFEQERVTGTIEEI
jgi:hypothetical protein